MRVLPDTPIWSAAFRQSSDATNVYRRQMESLLRDGVVELIGPIRQELFSGIKESAKFELIKERLRIFPDLAIVADDYEEAASYYNQCRAKGIQGSSTDFLICAVAVRNELSIFTDDRDFFDYQKILPIRLYADGKLR
jgi:hypothetical protein